MTLNVFFLHFICSSPDVLGLVLDTFDMALPKWCIYRIEQLQYDNVSVNVFITYFKQCGFN